jgi:peptidoglycan L-alanyl-D-glutamate endopeptidase CwlK
MNIKHGLTMRCTEGVRSIKHQQDLYEQGRTKPGNIVTNCKPGFSIHHYGLAADSCFLGHDPYLEKGQNGEFYWQEFGSLCKLEGLQWGGDFSTIKDIPHVQQTYGLSIYEIMNLFSQGGYQTLWKAISSKVISAPVHN